LIRWEYTSGSNHHGEWQSVVRYDHDGTDESEFAHNVTEEGLHIDIYRGGEKEAMEYVARRFEPISLSTAPKTIYWRTSNGISRDTNDGTGSATDDRRRDRGGP
jgi:hypothetical protein